MNPVAFPLSAAGLIAELTSRMMAFLILRVRGLAIPSLPPVTRENGALVLAFGERLTAFTLRATQLAEQALAGTLRLRRPIAFAPRPRCSGEARAPRATSAGVRLPRKFGWMLGFVTPDFHDEWAVRLTHGSMLDVLRQSPAFAGELRWFMRGIGLVPPDGVFPAVVPRVRASRRASDGASMASGAPATNEASLPEPHAAESCPPTASDRTAETPASADSCVEAPNPPSDADSHVSPGDVPWSAPLAQSVSGEFSGAFPQPGAPGGQEAPAATNPFSAAAILAGGSLGIAEPYYVGNPATAPVAATVLPVHVGERSTWEKQQEIREIIARGAQLPPPPRERVWYWRREI